MKFWSLEFQTLAFPKVATCHVIDKFTHTSSNKNNTWNLKQTTWTKWSQPTSWLTSYPDKDFQLKTPSDARKDVGIAGIPTGFRLPPLNRLNTLLAKRGVSFEIWLAFVAELPRTPSPPPVKILSRPGLKDWNAINDEVGSVLAPVTFIPKGVGGRAWTWVTGGAMVFFGLLFLVRGTCGL